MSEGVFRVDVAALLTACATFSSALGAAGDPRAAVPDVGEVPGAHGGTVVALAELLSRAAATTADHIERLAAACAAAVHAAADACMADQSVSGR